MFPSVFFHIFEFTLPRYLYTEEYVTEPEKERKKEKIWGQQYLSLKTDKNKIKSYLISTHSVVQLRIEYIGGRTDHNSQFLLSKAN